MLVPGAPGGMRQRSMDRAASCRGPCMRVEKPAGKQSGAGCSMQEIPAIERIIGLQCFVYALPSAREGVCLWRSIGP